MLDKALFKTHFWRSVSYRDLVVEPVHGRKTLLRGFGRPVANLEERGIDFPTVGKIGGQGREQSGETVPQEPIAFQNSAYRRISNLELVLVIAAIMDGVEWGQVGLRERVARRRW